MTTLNNVNKHHSNDVNNSGKTKNGDKRLDLAYSLKKTAIDTAIRFLLEKKKSNNGRLPHLSVEKVIHDLGTSGYVVDRNFINYKLGIAQKKLKELNDIETNKLVIEVEDIEKNRVGGRPVGINMFTKKELAATKRTCINDITKTYVDAITKARGFGNSGTSRTKKFFLKDLIESKWIEYDLVHKIPMVHEDTIRNRFKNKISPDCKHRGTPSPLAKMEDILVEIIVQMGQMFQPMTVAETIKLANDLIDGTRCQELLSRMKSKRCKYLPAEDCKKVGKGWWEGFNRRHEDKLITKRGQKFAHNRADWTKEEYISQMYDCMYDQFVIAGVAEEVKPKVGYDKQGNIVEGDLIYGLPSEIKITHPEFILFADETGCNTNQKHDGHYGGQKFMVGRGTVPKEPCVTQDKHFTVLGFTAASGDPVCCVIIFTGEKKDIPLSWTTGIDIQVEPIVDENNNVLLVEGNFGEGKYMPSGPTCVFRGKRIPMLPLISPSGGITGQLLVEILMYLDKLEVYERIPGGPVPVIVLDGHDSRLELCFLEYINDPAHYWYVSIGVPYATALWQVGDSPEQNGEFKMKLSEAKRRLVRYKDDRNIPRGICNEDIIPLLNFSWPSSFGRIRTNKKAIAERGWYPPNRILLLSKEIMEEKENQNNTVSTAAIVDIQAIHESNIFDIRTDINTNKGTAKTILDAIVRHRARTGGRRAIKNSMDRGKCILKEIDSSRRMTAGLLVSNGIHSLNHPSVIERVRCKKRKEKNLEERKRKKIRDENKQTFRGVRELRTNKPDMQKWNHKDCCIFIKYKREKKDGVNPKTIAELRERCISISSRTSPHCSDAEDDTVMLSEDDVDDELSIATDVLLLPMFPSHEIVPPILLFTDVDDTDIDHISL